jgi:DNA-binding response OmpR family regulator
MHYDDTATILVVEDDDATRTFLADNLTADGFELLVADCARDGIRLMETKFPDLALIDVGLPDGSGLDLVRRVRDADGLASRVDPRTPLLVLSGRDSELDRIRGFERGADDYVCTPFAFVPVVVGSEPCAAASPRCCAAPGSGRAPGGCASAS